MADSLYQVEVTVVLTIVTLAANPTDAGTQATQVAQGTRIPKPTVATSTVITTGTPQALVPA